MRLSLYPNQLTRVGRGLAGHSLQNLSRFESPASKRRSLPKSGGKYGIQCSSTFSRIWSLLNKAGGGGPNRSGLESGLNGFRSGRDFFGCIRNFIRPLTDPSAGMPSAATLLWNRGCSAAPPGAKGFGTSSSAARSSSVGKDGRRDGNCCDSHSCVAASSKKL